MRRMEGEMECRDEVKAEGLGRPEDGAVLTAGEQAEYVRLVVNGAAPLRACERVGVTVAAVLRTLDVDPGFRALVDQTAEVISGNVAAALYQAAMRGNVAAQTLFLNHRPPRDWKQEAQDDDELDRLSNAELLALCLAEGVAVPAAAQAALGAEPGDAVA
jgi:hypothetical protein